MNIIISHDVDHLFGKCHWFRDWIYPKLWVRSTIQLLKKQITFKEWRLRCTDCFKKERHRLKEIIDFDKANSIKSTFFFGMNQGLGMSYKKEEAKPVIQLVYDNGFDTGVHGICFDNFDGISKEHDDFVELMGYEPCGIRMHYVRFDSNTFKRLAEAGYAFDTTEFDKSNNGTVKSPYRVGNMIEFPLAIMDGYLPNGLEKKKEATLKRLEECKCRKLEYVSILFHDYQFCDAYSEIRDWYVWLVRYLRNHDEYRFVSYTEALMEIKDKDGYDTICK